MMERSSSVASWQKILFFRYSSSSLKKSLHRTNEWNEAQNKKSDDGVCVLNNLRSSLELQNIFFIFFFSKPTFNIRSLALFWNHALYDKKKKMRK